MSFSYFLANHPLVLIFCNIQIDVDIGSSSVARSVIGLVLGYVTSLVVDLAILIEVCAFLLIKFTDRQSSCGIIIFCSFLVQTLFFGESAEVSIYDCCFCNFSGVIICRQIDTLNLKGVCFYFYHGIRFGVYDSILCHTPVCLKENSVGCFAEDFFLFLQYIPLVTTLRHTTFDFVLQLAYTNNI